MRALIVGGTGFVGRHLCAALARQTQMDAVFAVHRQMPPWLAASGMPTQALDLQGDLAGAGVLAPDMVVLNLLRPDGSGWFEDTTRRLLHACHGVQVARYIHVSSIDVFGSAQAPVLHAASPAVPQTPYECEHARAEQLALASGMAGDVVVLRCGAIFGVGGANVVSLAREAARAPWWRLALRRVMYGERRMHLVSVGRIVQTLLAAMTDRVLLQRRDLLVVTDDAVRENNFAYLQDQLMRRSQRRALPPLPALPPWALSALLRARGISNTNPLRRFEEPRLAQLIGDGGDFGAELAQYVDALGAAA